MRISEETAMSETGSTKTGPPKGLLDPIVESNEPFSYVAAEPFLRENMSPLALSNGLKERAPI